MSPAPECCEVMANSILWDPCGVQWGRNCHWPLLITYGTKRYLPKRGDAAAARCHCRTQSRTQKKQRWGRIRRRACCAGGSRTTGGTGHRRCFRQRRRAAICAAKCAGGTHVESGELGRPHTVSRGLMQHMQLMAAHAAFLTFASDAPRMKTKKNIIVRASLIMIFCLK